MKTNNTTNPVQVNQSIFFRVLGATFRVLSEFYSTSVIWPDEIKFTAWLSNRNFILTWPSLAVIGKFKIHHGLIKG